MRWAFFGTLLLLHLAMNNPVWHLLARVNVVGGSTGWHRYHLIDKAIEHLEWWVPSAHNKPRTGDTDCRT